MFKKLRQRISRKRKSLVRRRSSKALDPVAQQQPTSPVSIADFDNVFSVQPPPQADPPGAKDMEIVVEPPTDRVSNLDSWNDSSSSEGAPHDSQSGDELVLVHTQSSSTTVHHDSSKSGRSMLHDEVKGPLADEKRGHVFADDSSSVREESQTVEEERNIERVASVEDIRQDNSSAPESLEKEDVRVSENQKLSVSNALEECKEEIQAQEPDEVLGDLFELDKPSAEEVGELLDDPRSLNKVFSPTRDLSSSSSVNQDKSPLNTSSESRSSAGSEPKDDAVTSNDQTKTALHSPERLSSTKAVVPAVQSTQMQSLSGGTTTKITPASGKGQEHVGKKVFIRAGANKGKHAHILRVKMKGTYEVELESGAKVGVRFTSVDIFKDSGSAVNEEKKNDEKETLHSTTSSEQPKPVKSIAIPKSASTTSADNIGKHVMVHAGKSKGNRGLIIGFDAGLYRLQLDRGEIVRVRPTSIELVLQEERNMREVAQSDQPLENLPVEKADTISMKDQASNDNKDAGTSENIGKRVRIHAGKNARKEGVIIDLKNKRTYKVQLETGETVGVLVSSVNIIEGQDPVILQNNSPSPNIELDRHRKPSKAYEGAQNTDERKDVIVETRQKSYDRTEPGERPQRERTLNLKALQATTNNELSRRNYQTVDDSPSSQNSSSTKSSLRNSLFRISGSNDKMLKFGRFRVKKMLLADGESSKKEDITFMRHLFGNKLYEVDLPIHGKKKKDFDRVLNHDGCQYELVSAKIEKDSDSSFMFSKKSVAKLVYINVSRDIEDLVSVKRVLEGLGDFAALNSRKVAVRLELFQSPARFPIKELDSSLFRLIREEGNVGCGFIAEDLLDQICVDGKMTKPAARLVSAIQVRLFIPSMGIFKGVLQRKRIESGSPPIEISPSMQKVLPSKDPNTTSRAAIVVCKNGVHPSPGNANEYIGRRFDPSRDDPPVKSFKTAITKKLSDMVLRLWQSLGVPEHELKKYQRESLRPQRRNHAWIVGVVDPTNAIPPDHVYIPGLFNETPKEIFVTRSPCLKHSDGRLIKTFREKPTMMSEEQWNELLALPFGSIVFAKPRIGKMSMPERIASGDLDGDLYLVCWDKTILSHMSMVEPMPEMDMEDDGILVAGPRNENWFEDARDAMVDANIYTVISKLTGVLFKLSEKEADNSSLLFKRDSNAIAFADAYNKALEFKKHGRPIYLPEHLHEKLPPSLRQYVTADPTS